jgi:repressor LexA
MIELLKDTDKKAYNLIRNKLIHEGKKPTLKEINAVTGGNSPRSAVLILERLIKYGLIRKSGDTYKIVEQTEISGESISTINVPLLGSVSCGIPMFAQENIETYIPISTNLAKGGSKYFLLRASGDSMNEAGINNGDILLIKQQLIAENGQKVVALINDEATVKFFEKTNDVVILRPKSNNSKHKPIILSDNCQIQGIVISILPADLN